MRHALWLTTLGAPVFSNRKGSIKFKRPNPIQFDRLKISKPCNLKFNLVDEHRTWMPNAHAVEKSSMQFTWVKFNQLWWVKKSLSSVVNVKKILAPRRQSFVHWFVGSSFWLVAGLGRRLWRHDRKKQRLLVSRLLAFFNQKKPTR